MRLMNRAFIAGAVAGAFPAAVCGQVLSRPAVSAPPVSLVAAPLAAAPLQALSAAPALVPALAAPALQHATIPSAEAAQLILTPGPAGSGIAAEAAAYAAHPAQASGPSPGLTTIQSVGDFVGAGRTSDLFTGERARGDDFAAPMSPAIPTGGGKLWLAMKQKILGSPRSMKPDAIDATPVYRPARYLTENEMRFINGSGVVSAVLVALLLKRPMLGFMVFFSIPALILLGVAAFRRLRGTM